MRTSTSQSDECTGTFTKTQVPIHDCGMRSVAHEEATAAWSGWRVLTAGRPRVALGLRSSRSPHGVLLALSRTQCWFEACARGAYPFSSKPSAKKWDPCQPEVLIRRGHSALPEPCHERLQRPPEYRVVAPSQPTQRVPQLRIDKRFDVAL